jgi:Ca2+-binding EF-hand superfamily protein
MQREIYDYLKDQFPEYECTWVDFEMFDSIVRGVGDKVSEETIFKVYNIFDKHRNGYISQNDFKKVCKCNFWKTTINGPSR